MTYSVHVANGCQVEATHSCMAANRKTKVLQLHHQGEFQHSVDITASLHDSNHDDVLRIFVQAFPESHIVTVMQAMVAKGKTKEFITPPSR